MGAIILSKFGKSQLCLVKDVAQGWSRKTLHLTNRRQHLPSLSGMKETKAIDNKEESHCCTGADTGMTGPFRVSTLLKHVSLLYVCLPVHRWKGIMLC